MADKSAVMRQSGNNNIQAGGDVISHVVEDNITTPELANIVRSLLKASHAMPLPDFRITEIREKNRLNGLSEEAFFHIKTDSIVGYEKIEAILMDPSNEKICDDYDQLVFALQTQYLHSNLKGKIERFFIKFIEASSSSLGSLKQRNWAIRLIYFMYLRCDVGIKG